MTTNIRQSGNTSFWGHQLLERSNLYREDTCVHVHPGVTSLPSISGPYDDTISLPYHHLDRVTEKAIPATGNRRR